MSEMNTPKDSRTVLSEKLEGIISTDPKNALASALKEALPGLTAAQAEQILNRLNNELPTSKGEEITHAPQGDRVAKLIEALKDGDSGVRREAAEALQEIKDPRAVEPLIGALKDEDSDVRWAAAWALGEIKDPIAVPALSEALKDGNAGVQCAAALALGRIKDPRAVPQLIEALKDEDEYVRKAAAEALGEIGDRSAIKPLQARRDGFCLGIFGRERNDLVRFIINDALNKLEEK